jgi:ribosome-binding factor A
MSQRSERLGDLLRGEISELVRREMRDPRVAMVTVSRVELSRDFHYAVVYVSALGGEAERVEAVQALEKARGFLRRELARRLDLRVTPELRFELDRGAEYSQQISDLLATLPASTPDGDGGEKP